MSFFVRAALIWLLALAIPIQGAVAAAMRCCGPAHGHAPSAQMSDAEHHHQADIRHPDAMKAVGHSHGSEHAKASVWGASGARDGGAADVNAGHTHAGQLQSGGHDRHPATTTADPVKQAAAGDSGASAAAHDHVSSKTAKAGKCSVCASCCTATGLPSSSLSLQAPVFEEIQVALIAAPPLEFTTAGPERPPRSLLV